MPKHGKISEKAFNIKIATSILGIVICLLSLSVSAWGMFSESVTIGNTTLSAAYHDILVEITQDGKVCGNGLVYTLNKGTYTAKVTATGSAKQSGYFVVVEGENTNRYYSVQMSENQQIEFIIYVSDDTKRFEFIPQWGTFSGGDGETKLIGGENGLNAIGTPQSRSAVRFAITVADTPEKAHSSEENSNNTESVSSQGSESSIPEVSQQSETESQIQTESQISEVSSTASEEPTRSEETVKLISDVEQQKSDAGLGGSAIR